VPEAPPPPARDRMAGRYCGQCPTCRQNRAYGRDCAGSGPVPPKARRKVEKRAVRRFVDNELGGDWADEPPPAVEI